MIADDDHTLRLATLQRRADRSGAAAVAVMLVTDHYTIDSPVGQHAVNVVDVRRRMCAARLNGHGPESRWRCRGWSSSSGGSAGDAVRLRRKLGSPTGIGDGMRIWYLSASTIPSRAANSVHVMKMCGALAGAGHRVALYGWTPRGSGESPFALYDVESGAFALRLLGVPQVRGTGRFIMRAALRLDMLRGPRPDLLYARNLDALYDLRRCSLPFVLEVHNPPGSAQRLRALRRLAARENFAGLVVISDALRREYEKLLPALRGRIVVAPDAADPLRQVSHEVGAALEWPGDPNRLQVGYVGHLYPGKGMETIAALAHVTRNVDLHVVGGSEADVARWRGRIATDAKALSPVWFHGYVSHAALPAYYARCDVFLAPYQPRVEGIEPGRDLSRWMSPLKIFEYMAVGKPILCSDLPVLREVLRHGENALLLDPLDVDAWAAALELLRGDAELRERLGATARRDFEQRYTWAGRAQEVLRQLAPRIPSLQY